MPSFLRKTCLTVLYVLLLAGSLQAQESADPLFTAFQHPSTEAKPCLYWWWLGNDPTREEIVRQLDLMHNAGVAGVHIVPIGESTGRLEWLSPEWWRFVKFAADEAKKRQMIVDLSASYGWPSGGPFVKPEHRLQAISCVAEEVTGPSKYEKPIDQLLRKIQIGERRVAFVRLVPKKLDRLDQVIDVRDVVRDGTVSVEVPEGEYVLYIGVHRVGIRQNKQNKQTGLKDDFALDYFDRQGVKEYLDHFAKTSHAAIGGRLGDFLHAFFVSSVEIYPANWTTGFAEEFQKRRGYDLMPYVEFATGMYPLLTHQAMKPHPDLFTASPNVADTIRRVRYDYNRTLVELFSENFVQQVQAWCREQGTLFRYQAYGHPWNIGMGENYMVPDIPEGNNWIHSTNPTHGWEVWNKYAAAGGHLTGKHLISNEAMTTQAGMFHETLDLVKRADDFNFITGNTRSVVHGWCYSPADAAPPGWSKYGLFVSEHNPWWSYFPRWTEYNARLSQVFQKADPVVDVAILCPTADVWSDQGLSRNAQQQTPSYGYKLWETLSQQGLSADYLHEAILQRADFTGGTINYGPMKYKLLVLCDVETMEPETAEAIGRYVEAGGKPVVLGKLPRRGPSLTESLASGNRVRRVVGSLTRNRITWHPLSPEDSKDLLTWTGEWLSRTHTKRRVTFSPPSPKLFQVQYRAGERGIFFLSNQDAEHRMACEADFKLPNKTPWRWDPETGTRAIYPVEESGRLKIDLAPSESLLLVFEPGAADGRTYVPAPVAGREVQKLDAPWGVKLHSFRGEETNLGDRNLVDFAKQPTLNQFAGTIVYETRFHVEPKPAGDAQVLDLGKINGVSEVWLNDKPLGSRWYGSHQYPVRGTLRSGENTLRVKVSTLLANGLTDPKEPRESTGMPGPVVLREARP